MPTTPMSGDSKNLQSELLARLQQDFPEVFNEGKIDTSKLKSTLGEFVEPDEERYGLSWAGKTDCFRKIQETTTNTLKPVREDSVDFDNSQNLFIEGDNLEVLKVLQRSYHGKVKMIYIDPPYNTGHDFVYSDKFARTKREELVANGSLDADGNVINHDLYRENTRDGGHFHSNWLNMIYPRLFLARNLLRQDGVIFVSIDDNEVSNLRKIMDEIFGEENFVAQIIWEKKYTRSNDAKFFSSNHDFILCYAKNVELFKIKGLLRTEEQKEAYKNPDNHPKGPWKSTPISAKSGSNKEFKIVFPNGVTWQPTPGTFPRYSAERLLEFYEKNEIWFGKEGNSIPSRKTFLSEIEDSVTPVTIWQHNEVGHNHESNNELKELGMGGFFDNPKPTRLLKRILCLVTGNNSEDIILDFFAGSGTTAHAVMALNAEDGGNRKWICVQLPEKCKPETEASKAGFPTIAHISRERIRRAGTKIKESVSSPPVKGDAGKAGGFLDLGFKSFKLDSSNFKLWNTQIKTVEELEQQMIDFVDNVRPESSTQNLLYELIIKSGYDLNVQLETCKTPDGEYYRIAGGELVICLVDTLTQSIFDAIIAGKPQKIITLDRSFAGNDQLKTNMVLMAEQEGVVEFKVI